MAFQDDAMNNRLTQILQMGSNANSYAAQMAQKRQALQQQTQMQTFQDQLNKAQTAMQAQQQAALKRQQDQYNQQYKALLNRAGATPPPVSGQSGQPGSYIMPKQGKGNTFSNFLSAISGQESGGNYGVVNNSSGALGKYQIMPGNIASWSRMALGHSVTPQQFLHNPQLQEQIAQHFLQNYYNKYGPAGAAVAWYAGEGTAQKYVRRNGAGFNAPQGGYPSINAYALSILHKMGLR